MPNVSRVVFRMWLKGWSSKAGCVLEVSDPRRRELFENSPLLELAFRAMALLMDSRLRRRFNDPLGVLEAAGVRPGIEILEVGCGTGFFTIPAARLVADKGHVHAIDLHPLAIDQVRDQVREKMQSAKVTNVSLTKSDALRTGMNGETFDLILIFGVVPSPSVPLDRLLREMHRLLRPEGRMALWTALPFWSPVSVTKSGLFEHVERRNGVHIFRKTRVSTGAGPRSLRSHSAGGLQQESGSERGSSRIRSRHGSPDWSHSTTPAALPRRAKGARPMLIERRLREAEDTLASTLNAVGVVTRTSQSGTADTSTQYHGDPCHSAPGRRGRGGPREACTETSVRA
jgi:demethylmenaquinone methyltransferase/2-methoxy-6-polyprenyl-1,4-benzoquinol methylase